jgi:hypothetical protein
VPVIAVAEADASPDTVVAHVEYTPSNPPAGTVIENCMDAPDTVPETVPRPVTAVAVSVIVSVPLKDDPVWVVCHVI